MAADDDQDIPETGGVFTFGKTKFAENVPSKFWIRNDHFLQVACGDEHSALIADSGRVFSLGANDWGQLGVGTKLASTKPTCIKSLKGEKGAFVACGKNHTLVATAGGRLYAFGANNEGQLGLDADEVVIPKVIDTLDDMEYKMISAGSEHSAAVTADGRLFIWGGGSEGQLGLGEDKQECPEPTEIIFDKKVTCVSCGYYHTAVVTEDGKLYTFGENDSSGKLGLGDDIEDNYTPQQVELIREKVKTVSCGGSHTAVVTEDGKVYTFGDGNNGQLGHGNTILQSSTPQVVNTLLKYKAKKVLCGENHTAVISEKNQLFTFGDGRHGKLGLGEENLANQFRPFKVSRFAKFDVDEVACGGCHMVALAKKNVRIGDGDLASSDEEEQVVNPLRLSTPHFLTLRGSAEEAELTITPRGRRHKDAEKSPMLNRTLPALKPTTRAPPLAPLSQTIGPTPVARNRLPQTSKEEPIPSKPKMQLESEEDSEEDNEKVVKKPQPRPRKQIATDDMAVEETIAAVAAAPVASAPQMLAPIPAKKDVAKAKVESEEEEDEDEVDSEEEAALTAKERAKLKKEKEKEDLKKKGKDRGKGKKKGEDSEDEDEESEGDTTKKKGKNKRKDKKKGKDKKKKGIFGKKKSYDSEEDEEDEDEDEDEDSEEEASKKKGKAGKKDDKKKKGKKGKKKVEESEEEDEDSEEEDRKSKAKAKEKKKKEEEKKKKKEEEELEAKKKLEEEEKKKEEEAKKKEEDEKKKAAEKPKKSKLCVIL